MALSGGTGYGIPTSTKTPTGAPVGGSPTLGIFPGESNPTYFDPKKPPAPTAPVSPPATPYPLPPTQPPKYFKPPKNTPYPAQDAQGNPISPIPGQPVNPVPGAAPNPQVGAPSLYNPYAAKNPALPPYSPVQYGKKPKDPFQSPATYQGPAGDVLPVPVDKKGKIKDKYISDFEKELAFAYRPGQFPANAAPTAYEQGLYNPDSPNYFNAPQAFSPEYNQQLLDFVKRPLEDQRDQSVRDLSERFANMGRVGAGRFGRAATDIYGKFGDSLSDAVTRIAMQQSLGQRAERLLGEERQYTSAETERDRRFQGSNRSLDRRLQRQLAATGASGASPSTAAAIGAGGGGGVSGLLQSILGGAAGGLF